MLNFGTWRSNGNAPIKKKRTTITRPVKRPFDNNSSLQDSVTRPVKRTTSGNAPTAEESFSSLKNEISLVEKSFEDCKKKKHEEEERLQSIKTEIEEYDKVLETREANLSLMEDLLGECKHEIMIKQIEIQNIDKEREGKEWELKDLCGKIDAKKKQLEGRVNELDLKEEQLKGRAKELDSKEEKLKILMNKLELEKNQFQGQLEGLRSKEKLFEDQVKKFDSIKEEFKLQVREFESKKNKFEDQVKEFEGRKKAFESEKGEYKAQMQQLKRFVRKMEDSISEEKQFEGRGKEVESREKQLEGMSKDYELREEHHDALIEPLDETIELGNQSSPSSEQNVELESVDDDILVRLKAEPDPAKVVLEIIHNPIIQREHMMGDIAIIIDDGDVLLLKELRKISPVIRPHVREEAMKLALDVKAYISQNTENSAAILGFLLLLSIYGLALSFHEDDVFKLFGFAAQHEIVVELFGTLGFADKASDFVENLIKRQQYDEAVRFSRAYKFSDNNQLVALFEDHVQNLKLISESSCKETNSIEIKDKARYQEVASLMAVMQSIKDNNLEFKELMDKIQNRIREIEDRIFELRI